MPTVLMAIEQVGGRGRLGRKWSSPPGGIYATLIVPDAPDVPMSTLPLGVSAALCRVLDQIVDPPCRLKWPNDLMVDGRKLGGILIEMVGRGKNVAAIIGFGVNYADVPTERVSGSTSVLNLARQAPSLGDLASRLIEATVGAVTEGRSMAEIIEEYSSWSLHQRGQKMSCRTPLETCCGTFVGFNELGFLRLQTDDGERILSAGELTETTEADQRV